MKTRWQERIDRIGKGHWASFPRCFLLTMGAALTFVPSYVWLEQGGKQPEWPAWAFLLLSLPLVVGSVLFTVGLLADKKTIGKWARHADSPAHPELTILMAVLAAPLFLLLQMLASVRGKDRRRK